MRLQASATTGRGWTAVAPAMFVALLVIGWPLSTSARFLLAKPLWELSRTFYRADPFNECPPVAEYLARHTAPSDRIAVLGSQPQICFLANRRSATGHIYMYPLTEAQPLALAMQQSMIDELDRRRPEYMVYVNDWVIEPGCPERIFQWLTGVLDRDYERVGAAEIISPVESVFVWDEAAKRHTPSRQYAITVYRRRAD